MAPRFLTDKKNFITKYLYYIKYFQVEALDISFLSVYSRGPSQNKQFDKFGVYQKTKETKNGKPIWENIANKNSVYYHGMISSNLFNILLYFSLPNIFSIVSEKYFQNIYNFFVYQKTGTG